jgi:hypothetical protein
MDLEVPGIFNYTYYIRASFRGINVHMPLVRLGRAPGAISYI